LKGLADGLMLADRRKERTELRHDFLLLPPKVCPEKRVPVSHADQR